MTVSIGDRLPAAKFKIMRDDGPGEIDSAEIFAGKKIVLFAVPGAFTPTCHKNHLPGFLEHLETIKARGIDDVAVVSVNDVWVMDQWAKATKGRGKIHFLSDGSGEFTRAIGMDVDLSRAGMGLRSRRYSMIVDDAKIVTMNVEEASGVTEVSGAAAILKQL